MDKLNYTILAKDPGVKGYEYVVRVEYDTDATEEQYRRALVRAIKGTTKAKYLGMYLNADGESFHGLYRVMGA